MRLYEARTETEGSIGFATAVTPFGGAALANRR
jgi:hypothetical protein